MAKAICLILCLLQILSISQIKALSCKDEANKDVDWFIVYKLPKIHEEAKGSKLSAGTAYAYLTNRTSDQPDGWTLSTYSVESEHSMLGKTWKDYNKYRENATYLFYNDEPPVGKGSSNGHLKGYFAFDDNSGFWMAHSIPKFGRNDTYEYPRNALNYGQHALCISAETDQLQEICHHLLYCSPKIYSSLLTSRVRMRLDPDAASLFTKQPAFIRRPPFVRQSVIESSNGQRFSTFAKDNQLTEDLYTSILAPNLTVSLYANTWRRGVGKNLPPTCKSDNCTCGTCESGYTILHVSRIRMRPRNVKTEIEFISTEDHSKWAIAMDPPIPKSKWICLADLNRMASQKKRGGGAICFTSRPVWKAFRGLILDTDDCP